MKIAVVQTNPVTGDIEGSLRRADALISACPGADVYVLPEMFSTGFVMNPADVAEPLAGPSLLWMREKAKELNAAVCGSVATAVELFTFVNRMYFVEPDGTTTVYDKRHLFSFAGENQSYAPGDKRVVVTFREARFLLEICYDLRFPVWSRCVDDYDVALYVASWPVKRRRAWDILLQARTIENQCFVAASNRVGEDDSGIAYNGGSVVLNPFGEPLASAPEGEEGVAVAELDLEWMKNYRQKFPALADRDHFHIEQDILQQ
ncbi:MAG: amidohydrolase [Bacteroidaceae bacterium]|nr:amidohydrolase [Bacteroidaceae bacterium]